MQSVGFRASSPWDILGAQKCRFCKFGGELDELQTRVVFKLVFFEQGHMKRFPGAIQALTVLKEINFQILKLQINTSVLFLPTNIPTFYNSHFSTLYFSQAPFSCF